jgi:peptide/nickel transport system permease protein
LEKNETIESKFSEVRPRVAEFRRFLRIMAARWVVIFGTIIIVTLLIIAVFAPQIAPYDPNKPDLRNRLLQPCREHLLGTDAMGRDTLSRIIYGGRIALIVGVIATLIAAMIGITLGLIAGYFGGIAYVIIMRLVDSLMAFPIIVMSLVLAVILGGGLMNIMIAVGIGLSSTYARVMCATVLSIKENEYIEAAHAMGASHLRVMINHVFMNCFPPILVIITTNMGTAIMIESALSYLGVGVAPPTAAWGSLVTEGYSYLMTHPTLALSPGIAIMLVVFSFNMVGDGLRDALDPRLRGTI